MKRYITLLVATLLFSGGATMAHSSDAGLNETILSEDAENSKQLKQEALLTSKKWTCLDLSKKKLTKKLHFEVGNEMSLSIDKKYAFKNNDYDYSNGKWKLDGKYLYFFYNAADGTNKVLTAKYKILKLNETTLILKRTEKPKGKITFK